MQYWFTLICLYDYLRNEISLFFGRKIDNVISLVFVADFDKVFQ